MPEHAQTFGLAGVAIGIIDIHSVGNQMRREATGVAQGDGVGKDVLPLCGVSTCRANSAA